MANMLLPSVVLRTCTVAVKDLRDVEHSMEVTAETLYEAIATALAAFQQDNWVGEIGQGFTMVTVVVQLPPVKHEVQLKDFVWWLGRRTFSGRGHPEAKAGENFRQGKSREDVKTNVLKGKAASARRNEFCRRCPQNVVLRLYIPRRRRIPKHLTHAAHQALLRGKTCI